MFCDQKQPSLILLWVIYYKLYIRQNTTKFFCTVVIAMWLAVILTFLFKSEILC